MEQVYRCQNCDWMTKDINDVSEMVDMHERLSPGDIVPDGECPECGAAVFDNETPLERLHRFATDLLQALEGIEATREAFQSGKRDGATMGAISAAMDAARAAIARAKGEK